MTGNDLGTFYSDACTTVATSFQIPIGQSAFTFYYKNSYSENGLSFRAVDADKVLTSGTLGVTSSLAVPTQVFAGEYRTYILLNTGALWAFGNNYWLGLGSPYVQNYEIQPVPVPMVGINGSVSTVGMGANFGCVLLVNGTIQCWGDNGSGQFGNGTNISSATPVNGGSGITTATGIGSGYNHTCVLLLGGTVQCWGNSYSGQLGNGANGASNLPVQVSGITTATSLSVGSGHACTVLSGGTVKCWGYNYYGQLGNNTLVNSNIPVVVSGLSSAVAVAAGGRHSCAVLSGGSVQCWGANEVGQLGNGLLANSSVPVNVSGITNAVSIAVGGSHSCAILTGGTVKCWGANTNGQLGNNSLVNSSTPVTVLGGLIATSISAGAFHTCAMSLSGGACLLGQRREW
jgi:alpha-tubulin suppressor-like RCC1 family protein